MKIIVIGSSSGGLEPTKLILDDLPSSMNAAIWVVRHSPPHSPSLLVPILSEPSALPVIEIEEGMPVEAGVVYVNPPGRTVVIESGNTPGGSHHFSIKAPDRDKEKKGRPSIDQALISAALHYKQDCIGIILSGYLDDGTEGAIRIDKHDGITIAQCPAMASAESMPRNVIERDSPDYIVPETRIGRILQRLTESEPQLFAFAEES